MDRMRRTPLDSLRDNRNVVRARSLIAQGRAKQMHVIRHHDGRMEPNPLPVLV
jgi:hypothetical protein